MPKNPSSADPRPAPAAGRRNFRLSSLEILITVLIFVGVLYLLTMWATNMFTPGEETAAPSAPPGAMVERALAASEKVLAEQISQSRDINHLRKQMENLQAQARKTPTAGAGDPVDAAQDRRLDEVDHVLGQVNHKVSQLPDFTSMLGRLDKLEKALAARPAASAGQAANPAPVPDPQVVARLDKLEKDLAARPAGANPAPVPDPQVVARLDKLEKDLAAKPAAPNPAAAALAQMEGRLQRLESGLREAREGQGQPRPAAVDPQLLARLERLEKASSGGQPAPSAAPRAEARPSPAAPKAEVRPVSRQASRAENEARKVSHKVRPGETLGGLARRYKVSENDIVRWNSMGTRRLLLKGESLVIYPGQNS